MNLYGLLDAIINKVNRAVKVEKQELDSSLQKQARENINVPSKNEVCNPNLLDNWYFRTPINQNGQSTYTNSGYTIDRWVHGGGNTIALEQDGILLTTTSTGDVWRQELTKEFLTKFSGQFMTFSVLAEEVLGSFYLTDGGVWAIGHADIFINSNTITTYTFQIPADFGTNYPSVGIWGVTGSSAKIIACKLEFGDTQTLAHQDSNGNWVLNEVPKYSEELLKSRQYDPYTGEYIGLRKFVQPEQLCNPNLLDNWYFGNPINQRGQVSYNNFDYTIDRYRIWDSQGTVTIEDGYLAINNNTEGTMAFAQHFEGDRIESLLGRTLTQSVLLEDGSLYSHTFTIPDHIVDFFPAIALKENTYVYFAIFSSSASYQPLRLSLSPGTSLNVKAVKLEYGTFQTLAHQDANGKWQLNEVPKYSEQLAACQRYFQRFQNSHKTSNFMLASGQATTSTRAFFAIYLPVSMRIYPTITVSDVSSIILSNDGQQTTFTATSVNSAGGLGSNNQDFNQRSFSVVTSGLTAKSGYVASVKSGGYVDFSADL